MAIEPKDPTAVDADHSTALGALQATVDAGDAMTNAKTIKAMKDARRGKLPSFTSVKGLMADLNADD